MKIEINPRSLPNLEDICEVLYKLHPLVLDNLIDMERSLGSVLGLIDINNPSLEEREFLANTAKEVDYSTPMEEEEVNLQTKFYEDLIKGKVLGLIDKNNLSLKEEKVNLQTKFYEDLIKGKDLKSLTEEEKNELAKSEHKDKFKSYKFHKLRKYIQLDTDEYIPMKISVEVEDPVIGKKVRELVRALEKTRAPEQFYFNKKEMDEDAYFAEGYGLTMNEEQRKKFDEFFWGEDVEGLKELLRKEKLYP